MQGPELDPGLNKLDEVFWALVGKSEYGLYSSQSKILLGGKKKSSNHCLRKQIIKQYL